MSFNFNSINYTNLHSTSNLNSNSTQIKELIWILNTFSIQFWMVHKPEKKEVHNNSLKMSAFVFQRKHIFAVHKIWWYKSYWQMSLISRICTVYNTVWKTDSFPLLKRLKFYANQFTK